MGKYFGTDGFRGEAGVALTSHHAYRIGRFLGWYFSKADMVKRVRAVVGKDTRRSGDTLEYAIASGLSSSGADVSMLHITTTPGVAYVTRQDAFDIGIMISASHNPYYDNGIKLVNRYGEKMDDDTIRDIETYLDGDLEASGLCGVDIPYATGERIGKIIDYASGRKCYIDYLISLSRYSFRDISVGLDCANGSAWMIAKSVFDALGAKTYAIHTSPDGLNINENAGSTHIEVLAKHVRENHLDIGFAFDGDADRCLAVDENGNVVNGDHILYILAEDMRGRGELYANTVVTTVMSNLGLYQALERAGMSHVQTAVGDRYVYESMQTNGYTLGGEQSGHIILSKHATTGDGILTAIKVMEAVISLKQPLSKLSSPVAMLPQVMKNVRVKNKTQAKENDAVKMAVKKVEERLSGIGRILVRESGTEPVIRVMVEAPTSELCESCVDEVISVIEGEGLI